MISLYTSTDAWRAFEDQDYPLAERIWLALMSRAGDSQTQYHYQLGYASALIAQKRYHEASDLLAELFDISGSSICLHQLGCIAREEGKLDVAKGHFLAEQANLSQAELPSLAANACELGLVSLLQHRPRIALTYAQLGLDYARKAEADLIVCCSLGLQGDIYRALGDAEACEASMKDYAEAYAELGIEAGRDLSLQTLGFRQFQLLGLLDREFRNPQSKAV